MQKTLKKWMSKGLAILASVMTVMQCVLPTYAQEVPVEPTEPNTQIVTSNVSVQVEGNGVVEFTENANTIIVTANSPYSTELPVGTSLHFTVSEQDGILLSSFALNGIVVTENVPSFEYDFTTTEENASFVIAFETESVTENSGVADENQGAEDEDVGNEAEIQANESQNLQEEEENYDISFFPEGFNGFGSSRSRAGGWSVSRLEEFTWLNGAGNIHNGRWTLSNGRYAFCGEGLMASPPVGAGTTEPTVYDNANVRKALYYGYGGPGDILTGQYGEAGAVILTNEALSNAYCGTCISKVTYNGYHWNLNVGNIVNSIYSLPDPIQYGYVAYKVEVPGQGINWQGVPADYQDLFFIGEMPTGDLQITKKSANTEITDDNPCYSLEGAEYGVFTDAGATSQIATLTIGADGKSNIVEDLKVGTYYVKETKAPKGYALDQTIYPVNVESAKLTTREFVDIPQSDPVGILLGKVDKETNANKPQGSASLEGAEFTVKYYKGLFDTDPSEEGEVAERTWVLKTNNNGFTLLDKAYLVSGDDFYYNGNSDPTLPIGTITIQETKAPEGYKLSDEVFVRKITSEGNTESVNTYNEPEIPEQVYLGNFTIRKFITNGNESEIVTPEKGAEFIAIYKGYVDQYGSIEEAMKHTEEFDPNEWSTLITDENGVGTSGDLAYGTYVVKQTAGTPETDLLEETFEVTITEDGQHFEYMINNRPSDYYVKIVKKDADNGKIVSFNGASFKLVKVDEDGNPIANYTDKGAVRTDENGVVSVKAGLLWYDTFTTNADNRLSIVESLGRYEASTSEDKGTVTVPQKLPSGNYVIKEFETPDGYLLGQDFAFSLKKSNITEIDPDGDSVVTIEYSDPKPTGRIELKKEFEDPDYIMHGEVTFDLYVTQDIVDPADGTVLYKAGDKYGTYTLNKENNTIVIEGLPMGVGESHFKLVEKTTYENYQLNNNEYAVDFVQTDDTTSSYTARVTVENELIHIGTKALNADTNGKEFNSAKEITITDTVSYEGLIPNQEYTMHATLMNKETGEAVLNEDGTPVEGYKKFIPMEANGTVDVTMTLDASQLGGQDFVVFESLLNTGLEGHEGCEIARHQDLTDENQTITILPSKIGTTAKSENGSHEQQVTNSEITLTDTVAYEGLVPNMEYKLEGVLMNQETGKKLLDANGKEITSNIKFTPETSSGTIDVTFTFDASKIQAGESIVVFETLFEVHSENGVNKKILVASHEDIEDEGQTINFIDIHTNASSENGSNEQQETEKEVTLIDTVSYEGLQVGKEYTVSGKLMNKETGEPLLDVDGNEITAETTFTPEEPNGTVDVEFTFDMTGIKAGTDIVVFESLNHDGIEVAVHADINDEDQTIPVIDIQTEAESQNGTHTAPTGSKVTITDHVSYTNLEVGKEYTVKGVLMNKETSEPLLDADGNEITAETTFTPEEPNGVVDLEYTLDSSLLAGKETVVFEDLYKDDILVATHSDINDENQTIKFKNWEILVNKVDSITRKNIVSKEFEFTMYADEELQEKVVTKSGNTEDGTALFEVTEGTWYIKETKAPEGYKLSDEVVKVEIKDNEMFVNDKRVETDEDYLYSIIYQNALLPVIQTGTSTNQHLFMVMGLVALCGIIILFSIRKWRVANNK